MGFGVPIPSVINFETGIAHPIAGVFDPPIFDGRNRVLAVLTGPSLLRVVVEGCLPLRDEPTRNGPVIECAAFGALFRPTGEQRYPRSVVHGRLAGGRPPRLGARGGAALRQRARLGLVGRRR